MSPLASLGIVLLQVLFILVPFAILALIVGWITRGRRVEHITCGNCLYNVEFAPSPRCQECGSELAEVGVLHPKMPGGRVRKTRAIFGMYLIISLPPAIVLGIAVAEHADDMAYRRAAERVGGFYEQVMKTIIAIGPASGAYQELFARAHYRVGPGPFHFYEQLDIGARLNDGAKPFTSIQLNDRTIEWAYGDTILPPEIAVDNEGRRPRVLAEADLDRGEFFAWLGRQGIDTDREDVREEVNEFLDYVLANMTTETLVFGIPAPPGLGAFRTVMIPFDVAVPGAGAGMIPGPLMALIAWGLLMLIPLSTLQRTNVQRRRAARAWIEEQSKSAGRS